MAVGQHIWQPFQGEERICYICGLSEGFECLPCHHFCCKGCVVVNTDCNKALFCPVCHTGGGEREKDTDEILQPNNMYCESCSDSTMKARAFCNQCRQHVCQKCVDSHKRMKVFESHDLVPVRAEMSNQILDFEKCKLHGAPLIIFCSDCQALACHLCIAIEHRSHSYEFCAASSPKIKTDLKTKVSLLHELKEELKDAMTDQYIAGEEIMANIGLVTQTINIYFDKLHQILDKHKNDLLDVIESTERKKVKETATRLASFVNLYQELDSITKYTEQCIENCTDNEIMTFHSCLLKRMNESVEKMPALTTIREPIAFVGLDMKLLEEFDQMCADVASLTQIYVDPKKCTMSGTGLDSAEVNKMSEALLAINLNTGKSTKCRPKIEAQLKTVHNNTIVQCTLKRTESGLFCVQYIPNNRGLHSLSVSVNEKEISYSPYFVFVSISPLQFCKPVNAFHQCVANPTAIAVNSAREIIVAEFEGDIVVLDQSGKELRRIKQKKHGFQELSGLTIDEEDNLYFVDLTSTRIYKSSAYSTNVLKKKVTQLHGPGHCGLVVSHSELLVCECHNEGTIQIYDKKDLTWSRTLTIESTGLFLDIAVDSSDNLYVVDNTYSCIQVIDKQGMLLRSVGNGMPKLTCPRNVCVTGQYVFVSDWVETKVGVFTLKGEYITSFGSDSDSDGPQGIHVDSSGFVYICNLHKSTIEVY